MKRFWALILLSSFAHINFGGLSYDESKKLDRMRSGPALRVAGFTHLIAALSDQPLPGENGYDGDNSAADITIVINPSPEEQAFSNPQSLAGESDNEHEGVLCAGSQRDASSRSVSENSGDPVINPASQKDRKKHLNNSKELQVVAHADTSSVFSLPRKVSFSRKVTIVPAAQPEAGDANHGDKQRCCCTIS